MKNAIRMLTSESGRQMNSFIVTTEEGGLIMIDGGYAFDGLVALGDRVALGAVNALKVRGIRVGVDVRVMGMDDSIYSRISSPAISTINRHTDEMAERGVDALLAMMQGADPQAQDLVVPHEVVERATTLGA